MLRSKPYLLSLWICFFSCLQLIAQQPELVLPVGHTETVRTARFSPDGQYVLTGGADKVVNVWETFTGKKIRSLGSNDIDIIYAFFSNDSKFIAVGTDSSVVIWSVPAYVQLAKFDHVRYSLFSPDGKRLFLTAYNGNVKQVNLATLVTEYEYTDHVAFSFDITRSTLKVAVSSDNKWVAIAGDFITIREIESGKIITQKKPDGIPVACFFSYDKLNLVVVTDKGIQKIGLKNTFPVSTITKEPILSVFLSSNNKFLITNNILNSEKTIFWDFEKYKPLFIIDTIRSGTDTTMEQDKDGTDHYKIIKGTAPYQIPARLLTFTNMNIDDSGNYFWTMSYLWNNKDFSKSYRIDNNYLNRSDISRDGNYLLTEFNENGAIQLWDIKAQKIVQTYQTHAENITISGISPDGTKMLIGGANKIVKVSFVGNGQTAYQLEHKGQVAYAAFSKDGKYILTNSYDSTARLWDAASGKLLQTFYHQYPETNPAYFSRKGNIILTKLIYDSVPVYDLNDPDKITGYSLVPASYYTPKSFKKLLTKESKSGRYSIEIIPYREIILKDSLQENNFSFETMPLSEFTQDYSIAFSADEKTLVFAGDEKDITLLVWDIEKKTWRYTTILKVTPDRYGSKGIEDVQFSLDDKFLLVADMNAVIHVLNGKTFNPEFTIPGKQFSFSGDGKYMIVNNEGKCDIYDFNNRQLLYSYISVDPVNYLVVDAKKRFDGTELSRRLLYYACGNEIIDLDQAKDQLWVPNLAERIMKGDSINAKTLDELNICGLTPVIEDGSSKSGEYYFKITPRRGGLGETILSVNGNPTKTYKPGQLKKNGGVYELVIPKEELAPYFIAGAENQVTVKAYTSDNAISSRGLRINETNTQKPGTPPNLYAVMVGVSDYKGDELDLKYAAKDATDISAAISNAAKKLLNTDGKDHVFMYNLTTATAHYLLPEKKSIQKTLEEIGKKATANDILLIFFAGHGVMAGLPAGQAGEADKKQFYFLSADASTLSTTDAVKDVGISTAELVEWMKPENIKAQKRVLIFDACNSGQAINDIAGKDLAVRNDDKAQQVKAIDKLNEKSGLFILSASATNQSAYEMGRYSQGLLTYSLLKAIKQQPDILDQGKYLDVSRWFNAAKETVSDLAKESGARQEPQIVSNTNFNIGLVDDEVIAKIVLPEEKPLFAASNFQNSDEKADGDDLDISKLINLQLNEMAARGSDSKIVYIMATNSPEAFTLGGRYDVKGNQVTIRVSIKKNNETKYRFEEKGAKDKLGELANSVVTKASNWTDTNK